MFSVCESAEDSARPFRAARIRDQRDYVQLHALSVSEPDAFWGRVAREFCWRGVGPASAPLCSRRDFGPAGDGPVSSVRWFEGWETNVCFNALDRNVAEGLGHRVAYHWEGNGPEERTSITYRQLLRQVCQFANVLKRKGVKKGDRVTVYLPMIVEAVTAMLACSRIGATHNVVFAGFSSESLAERMIDAQSNLLVTADGTWRGNKLIPLKELADGAVKRCRESQLPVKCIVVRHLGAANNNNNNNSNLNHVHNNSNHNHCRSDDLHRTAENSTDDFVVPWDPSVDCWWHEEMSTASPSCDPEWVDSQHPLFILYTSGSTGKPKGVVHGTGGYMVYAATTFQLVFAHEPSDVYFCTADLGWITGHTYGVYGPLLQGATSILFQGIPTHPDPGRYWAIVERYGVSKFYTSPTALRTLRKYGDSYITKYRLDSLEVLGSVGEPIDPDTWRWYQEVVGGGRCQIVDTFWQSETGGHMITPLPGCTPQKPGSAGLPFFGVVPAILDDQGTEIEGPGEGHLIPLNIRPTSRMSFEHPLGCPVKPSNVRVISFKSSPNVFKKPWPGMMLTLFGSQEKFEATYFRKFPGYYCSGDGARRDAQGLYWITGRTDDLLNVSGHLLSTAEVEAALASHSACAEAAAVAVPHPVKGECLHCFVVLTKDAPDNVDLVSELKETVRSRIGAFACPDRVRLCPGLPKTRSGKVMRRVLRKVATGGLSGEEDLSTLADPLALQQLISSS